MKQRMSNKKTIALFAPFMGLIAVVMAALIVLSVMFAPTISRFLGGIGGDDLSEETLSEGTELVEDIVEEGTVLLKNEDDALPLSADEMTKVNVFGWAAYDWMTSTYGSGYSNTTLTKVKFFDALRAANIQYNTTLYDMYKNFYSATTSKWGMSDLREYRGDVEVGGTRKFVLHEPGADYYTDEIIAEAREFSSVALVVIGRTGGEAADLRFHQEKQVQSDGSSATVTDNTRTYLQLSTEEEEMIAAAKAVHAHGFIRRLPKGYDTVIGSEGALSEVQKQLLCVARVMICRPPMLILDEATSSIDTRTEMRVQDAFSKLMQGRTCFIVAHRLSTIENADLILVMKAGTIIEQGTHKELLQKGGFYSELYKAQFAG